MTDLVPGLVSDQPCWLKEDTVMVTVVIMIIYILFCSGARCSSMVRAFAHGAIGRRIDPSWPIELFLFPASAPWLV